MKSALFILLVCSTLKVPAQQDPGMFISVGRGGIINPSPYPWTYDGNTSVLAGYRLWSNVMVVGYFDYIAFSYSAYFHGLNFSGNYHTNSFMVGAKTYATIPNSRVSPFFVAAIGLSNVVPSQDTILARIGNYDELGVYKVNSGKTASFLGAVGTDIRIYRGLFISLEIRASSGFDTEIYDLLWMYRASIGIAFY